MDNKYIRECDIVQDLLPLYYDDVCNDGSKAFVEEHLSNCVNCKKTYDNLKEDSIERIMGEETTTVLEHHAKKEKTAAFKAGIIIAGVLLLPIIITFIYSLVTGGGLGVFMVVLAAMLLVGALTVVPLTTSENRFPKTVGYSVIALLLIIFFADRLAGSGEFVLIAIPTIFGISLVFFPFVVRTVTLPFALANKKALITVCWDTLWLYLTILVVSLYNGDAEALRTGIIVATIFVLLAWIVLLIARYLPFNRYIKAGFITVLCSIWTSFANDVTLLFLEHKRQLTLLAADFSNWTNNICINANVYVLTLIIGCAVGILLIAVGLIRKKKHNQ